MLEPPLGWSPRPGAAPSLAPQRHCADARLPPFAHACSQRSSSNNNSFFCDSKCSNHKQRQHQQQEVLQLLILLLRQQAHQKGRITRPPKLASLHWTCACHAGVPPARNGLDDDGGVVTLPLLRIQQHLLLPPAPRHLFSGRPARHSGTGGGARGGPTGEGHPLVGKHKRWARTCTRESRPGELGREERARSAHTCTTPRWWQRP